jgi:AraC-like DNA-binding protein
MRARADRGSTPPPAFAFDGAAGDLGVAAAPGAARPDPPGPIQFRRVADLPHLALLVASETEHLFRVYHETVTLCAVSDSAQNRASSGQWWYRGRDHTVSADSLMLMEPGECHVTKSISGRPDFRALHLDPAWIDGLARELGYARAPHWRVAQLTGVTGLLDCFGRFLRSLDAPHTALERETRLLESLGRAFLHGAELRPRLQARESPSALRQARDYLHAHVDEAVTLDALSQVAGLSRFHLIRAFKKTYGLAPHAYHTELRVAAARRQLEAGRRPSELDVGFYDQSHLNRNFRRSLGVTPHGYRSAVSLFTGPASRARAWSGERC